MNQDATPLSVEILERFRAALQAAGAPLGSAIGPGVSAEGIARYAGALGAPVPPELQTLWKWGCPSPEAGDQEAGWDINAMYELWPPDVVVRMTASYRESDPDLSRCIAFSGPPQDGCLVITADESAVVSAVRTWYIDDPDPLDSIPRLAPSLGVLFELLTGQLTNGYRFENGRWRPEDPLPWPRFW